MKQISIHDFFAWRTHLPVVDVRSPGEYQQGHIPGSQNIPLFDDSERATIGIAYKRQGRLAAIKEGLKMVGPKMADLVIAAESIAVGKKLILHCWRGGMRSENMAWLFSRVGIESHILSGGYKSYRNHCRKQFQISIPLILLGGYTGSGKTEILQYLEERGEQCLDLEKLASHKGSVFGGLGQQKQLPNEHFENLLFEKWIGFDPDRSVWVEDESKMIGKNCVPDELYHKMRLAPVIALEVSQEKRLRRLVKEYGCYDRQQLKDSILKIHKRLGGKNTQEALEAVDKNDFYTAARIILRYYDKAYHHGLNKREDSRIHAFYIDNQNFDKIIPAILEKSQELLYNQTKVRT